MRTLDSAGTSAALLLAFAFPVLAGCAHGAWTTSSRSADEQAIRELVNQTVDAAGRRDMASYSKFYAPGATLLLPGMPITNLAGPMTSNFAAGYAIKMVTVKVEVSDQGDLAYAVGTYEQTAPDKTGALTNSVGKWMSVFKKQRNGVWGAVADTYNVDPPS